MNHRFQGIKRLFIDANIIIYFLESRESEFTHTVQKIFTYCIKNNIEICSSELSIWECLFWVYKYETGIENIYMEYFSDRSVISLFPIEQTYFYEAAKLGVKNTNLFDAIHLITAWDNDGDVFLTNDKKMTSDKIPILQLSDL